MEQLKSYICSGCLKTSKDSNFLVESDIEYSICYDCSDSKDIISRYLSYYIKCIGEFPSEPPNIPKYLWPGIRKYFPITETLYPEDEDIYRKIQKCEIMDEKIIFDKKTTSCWTTNSSAFKNNKYGVAHMFILRSDPRILFWNCPQYADEILKSSKEYKQIKSAKEYQNIMVNNVYAMNIVVLSDT